MSLFTRPVIFIPGSSRWDPDSRRHVPGMARRNLRRRPYPSGLRRHLLDYVLETDLLEDLFEDDSPESLYEIADVPIRYVSVKPREREGQQKTANLDRRDPEALKAKKFRNTNDRKNIHDSAYESERSEESEEEAAAKDVGAVVMDLDQIVEQIFDSLYGLKPEQRGKRLRNVKTTRKMAEEDNLKKNKEAAKQKSASDQKPTAVKETKLQTETKQKTEQEATKSNESKKASTEKVLDIVQERDDARARNDTVIPQSNDVEVVFVIESDQDAKKDSRESPKDSNDPEQTSRKDKKEESEDPDETTDMECSPEPMDQTPEDDVETESQSGVLMAPDRSNPEERQVDEVRVEPEQFQVTYDLSFFRPEEIQVKLTDDRLILDAVHEVVENGSFEKQTMHREIGLPPSIDTESLRCRLAEDGHMMISADYLEKSKQVRVLPIEIKS